MKKVVLDTNILLVCISDRSRLHWIFQSLIEKKYCLCLTSDIMAEYAEIIERHMGQEISESVLGVIENISNKQLVNTYYRFQLLRDEDDDKFVDCAIAANADYIVSHDKDFKVLEKIDFPKVRIINTQQFKEDLKIT